MDQKKFDEAVKRLSHIVDRRKVVKGTGVAGALAAIGVPVTAAQVGIERCRANGKTCRGRRKKRCEKCCSNIGALNVYTVPGQNGGPRCACRPDENFGCVNDSQCCSGICDLGSNTCVGFLS
jgi:hypothetical protein